MARPTFHYPFAGTYPISSPFGPRGGGMHTGVDFAVPTGVPILASNDGQVVYAAYESGAGNTVTVSGADGWQSRYHHLQSWSVRVGQQVSAGTQVGICNNTGSSTGPHLHFEIRSHRATPVDPIPILEADVGTGTEPDEPAPEPVTDTEDVMLIVNRATGDAAVILGNHLPAEDRVGQRLPQRGDRRPRTGCVAAVHVQRDQALPGHDRAVVAHVRRQLVERCSSPPRSRPASVASPSPSTR